MELAPSATQRGRSGDDRRGGLAPDGQAASYGDREGWTGMLIHLEAWIEHGLDLRTGFYV